MSKIVFEKKKNTAYIVNRLSYPEAINDKVQSIIASGMIEGLLPVEIIRKRKTVLLRSEIRGELSLNRYFDGIVSRKEFLDIVSQLVALIKRCAANMINPENLDLRTDRIFVDSQKRTVSCVYWPIVNNQTTVSQADFFKQLLYNCQFNEYESREYLKKYAGFFTGLDPFSLNNFDKMISLQLGNQKEEKHAPSDSVSGEIGIRRGIREEIIDPEYDPFGNTSEKKEQPEENEKTVRCPECGSVNKNDYVFCIHCGKELSSSGLGTDNTEPPTTPLYSDETVLLSDNTKEAVFPYLIRESSGDKIPVDKPSFRIGKEKEFSDYFVSDNCAVSRSHADIRTRNARYYIVDLNSTNKTYVDGKPIPVREETEIIDGTKIRLANEDFVFHTEG